MTVQAIRETRELKRYAKKDNAGLFKYLARFEGPADIRGTALLTWEQKDREDDQWLYMPAYGQKLKRIAGGNKKGYFMGTDFSYEDLRPEKLETHTYNVLKKEKCDNQDCYVIESLPSTDDEKKTTGYAKRILWITTDTFVTLKVDFYDHSMKLLKTQTAHNVKINKRKADARRQGLNDTPPEQASNADGIGRPKDRRQYRGFNIYRARSNKLQIKRGL